MLQIFKTKFIPRGRLLTISHLPITIVLDDPYEQSYRHKATSSQGVVGMRDLDGCDF